MSDFRLDVLFLIPSLRGGGSERVMVSLLRHMSREKFRLGLAVVDTRDAIFGADVPADVEVIDLGCTRVRSAIPRIIRLIWTRRPNVVVSTLSHLNLAVALVRPFLPRGTRIVGRESVVVSLLPIAYSVPFWWHWAYRNIYSRFDTVVCQSNDMREDLILNFGLQPEKSVVINNPVDAGLIRALASAPVATGMADPANGHDQICLVAAGRLTAQKGFDLLIQAMAIGGDPRIRLTLLGEGPMRDDLQRLARDLGVAGQIRFVGFQRNPYPFMAQADAFVLSSRFEGFPNVILEALACGTPVIATPAPGGVREILEGLPGCLLAKSVSAESLAEALVSFKKGRRMSPTAIAAYGIETIVKRYEQVFLGNGSVGS